MFSDMPSHPRTQHVIRKSSHEPKYIAKEWPGPDKHRLNNLCQRAGAGPISGADILLYLKSPVIRISPDIMNESLKRVSPVKQEKIKYSNNKCVQTVYRESSAQTKPWFPENYIVPDGTDPEILKVNFLRDCLPAGMHELELIKRARKRRTWESLIPDKFDEESTEKRRCIIEAIETDQWAFREQEIQDIQNMRMVLLEKMLQEILDRSANRTTAKLQRIAKRLNEEKSNKLQKLKRNTAREMRRLERQYKNVSGRYREANIIAEHSDYTSEIYAPLMRHGIHPKRGHEIIEPSEHIPRLVDIENVSTLPSWIYQVTNMKDSHDMHAGHHHLCIRETKWTEPVLKHLHEELQNLRQKTKVKCTLRQRIVKTKIHHETLMAQGMEDWQEVQNHAALLLQSVIRGRVTQSMIYEGRDRCRELIMELQNTFPLQDSHAKRIHEERINVMAQQRDYQVQNIKMENVNEMLCKLEGTVVGTMLDFLNKEYRRLLDERRTHALAMLYERERQNREAADAGRRQLELRRRREHDEIFKQIVKVHQDTVDLYLKDIIMEGVETVSSEQACEYIKQLAEELDIAQENEEPLIYVEKEEMIADMVHHYVIPDIEKTLDRQRIRERQQQHLKNAHNTIFATMEELKKIRDEDLSFSVGGTRKESIGEEDSCECTVLDTCDPRLSVPNPKLKIIN